MNTMLAYACMMLAALTSLGQWCHADSPTGSRDKASQATIRKLAVFVDVPQGYKVSSRVYVLVMREGQCVASTTSGLQKPILIAPVPKGKVTVAIVPVVSRHANGLMAKQDVLIGEHGTTVVRIRPEVVHSAAVKVTINNPDGSLLRNKDVSVYDTTNSGIRLRGRMRTTPDGELTVHTFRGRKYIVRVRMAIPQIVDLRSPVMTSENADKGVQWRMRLGPIIKLRFLLEKGKKREFFKAIRSVSVLTEMDSGNYDVIDGALMLSKVIRPLKGAKRITLDLLNSRPNSPAYGYEIIENETIDIDQHGTQSVDVVLAPRRVTSVLVRHTMSPGIKKQRYLGRNVPRVYFVSGSHRKVVARGVMGKALSVPWGQYTVVVWHPNYRISQKKVEVKGYQNATVDMLLEDKSPLLSLEIRDSDGKPPATGAVRVIYANHRYLRVTGPIDAKTGQLSIPFDDSLKAGLHIYNGGNTWWFPVTDAIKDKKSIIRLMEQCDVSVKLAIDPKIDVSGNDVATRWTLRWVPQAWPTVVVSRWKCRDGRSKGQLAPGKYLLLLCSGDTAIPVRTVNIEPKQRVLVLNGVDVSKDMYDKAGSLSKQGIR